MPENIKVSKIALSAAAAAMLMLSGCGSDDDNGTAAASSSVAVSSAETVSSAAVSSVASSEAVSSEEASSEEASSEEASSEEASSEASSIAPFADAFTGEDSVTAPATDEEKARIRVAGKFDLNGEVKDFGYKTILRTGAAMDSEIFGQLKDMNDEPLLMEDGSAYLCNGQFGGSGPDHTEFIETFGHLFMLTQFECQIGAMYLAELDQDATSGELSAKSLKFISQKDYHGGFVHCAGSKTPWNTFLGSEEYEPDARKMDENGNIDSYYGLIAPYWGGDLTLANPYFYGWTPEVTITSAAGDTEFVKHYTMGRFAHELAIVMPDQRTAFLTDDGTNCAFFMFVADEAGDLSAGTLYAAKWNQTSDEGAGAADWSWVKLGSATDAELKAMVDSMMTFDMIFDTADVNEDGTCPEGFTSINTTWGQECLAVKEGMETAAAFLESRRYAALMGATTEFRKMEGLTYDIDLNRVYVAMSEVRKGMEDGSSSDTGGNNDIRLASNSCGAVYAMDIEAGMKDADGMEIGSAYTLKNIYSIVEGAAAEYDENGAFASNGCDLNGIANPDNVTYLTGSDTLIIGEDTGKHQNDMIWAFDTNTSALTARVATTPFGSETTSPYWQEDINGFTYMNFVTQHPFGESDADKIQDDSDVESYVGYAQIMEQTNLGNKSVDTFAAKSTSVATPVNDTQKAEIRVAPEMKIMGEARDLEYNTVLRTGMGLNGETFGLLKDMNDEALMMEDGSAYICNGQFGGSGPDHTQFIEVDDALFMITQFECQIGAMYMAELNQDPATGELSPLNLKFISQKDYHGGFVHCAGSKTPWNTFLGSEEYEPNAKKLDTATGELGSYYNLIAPYWGGDLTQASPYYYGWTPEVTILNADGDTEYVKHYAMGRYAHELAYVMPDSKTAYMTDDGTNCGFFMFVADEAGDLSAGTLYAVKWNQTSAEGVGAADLGWVKLAHGTDAAIKEIVDSKPLFTSIFDEATANEDNTCPEGYTSINTTAGHECLAVKEGMETAAAFLETRRYAAMMGATTEFRKMEGLTFNPEGAQMYVAMSEVRKGMEDDSSSDVGGNNDIRLTANKCGAVYAMDVATDMEDTDGNAIDSAYTLGNIYGLVAGNPMSYADNGIYADNSCDINSIANPDNVTYLPGSSVLLIGEDTGSHQNDMVWSYHVTAGLFKDRVATTPFGSETTSPYWQGNIGGQTYINLVTQHPFGESDADKIQSASDVESYVGYIHVKGDALVSETAPTR